MSSRKLAGLFWGVAWSFLLAGLAQAAEFSALTLTKAAGQEMQGKIYVKGEKVRMEAATPMGLTISILRPDKQVMWMMMPGQKSYMEMPMDQKAFGKVLNLPEDGANKKLLGTEMLNGYEAEKYETSVKAVGQEIKTIVWISKKLGMPLRIESVDKSFTQDYQDIKEGGVADAVFEMPAGYKKMAMPAGMPKMQ